MAPESKPAAVRSSMMAKDQSGALLDRPDAGDGYPALALDSVGAKTFRWNSAARMDLYAAGLSTLCVLHCVALPVLVAVLPAVAQAAQSELVHKLLVVAAVPVSLQVVWKARAASGNRLFVGAVFLGLALLVLAAFVEATSAYEEPITIAGGAVLVSAHMWHWLKKCIGGSPQGTAESGDCLDCRCPE